MVCSRLKRICQRLYPPVRPPLPRGAQLAVAHADVAAANKAAAMAHSRASAAAAAAAAARTDSLPPMLPLSVALLSSCFHLSAFSSFPFPCAP